MSLATMVGLVGGAGELKAYQLRGGAACSKDSGDVHALPPRRGRPQLATYLTQQLTASSR